MNNDLKLLIFAWFFLIILFLLSQQTNNEIKEIDIKIKKIDDKVNSIEITMEEKIANYAKIYDINIETALRIAWCESRYDPLAKNSSSSAKGIYQFIDKTWQNYCDGSVLNSDDNIQCFMILYKKNPQWWECK